MELKTLMMTFRLWAVTGGAALEPSLLYSAGVLRNRGECLLFSVKIMLLWMFPMLGSLVMTVVLVGDRKALTLPRAQRQPQWMLSGWLTVRLTVVTCVVRW